MQITETLPGVSSYFGTKGIKTGKDAEEFQVSESANSRTAIPSDSQIVSYYKKLCEDYPDVTFKMSDLQTPALFHMGYKGDSHQQGENFSCPDRCSIQIDVSVIKKMMADEDFEAQIKGTIGNIIMDYPRYIQWAKRDGCGYCYYGLSTENGKLTEFIGESRVRASTDEELREMWKDELAAEDNASKEIKISYEKLINSAKNQMQETFFSMFDKAQYRRSRVALAEQAPKSFSGE